MAEEPKDGDRSAAERMAESLRRREKRDAKMDEQRQRATGMSAQSSAAQTIISFARFPLLNFLHGILAFVGWITILAGAALFIFALIEVVPLIENASRARGGGVTLLSFLPFFISFGVVAVGLVLATLSEVLRVFVSTESNTFRTEGNIRQLYEYTQRIDENKS